MSWEQCVAVLGVMQCRRLVGDRVARLAVVCAARLPLERN